MEIQKTSLVGLLLSEVVTHSDGQPMAYHEVACTAPELALWSSSETLPNPVGLGSTTPPTLANPVGSAQSWTQKFQVLLPRASQAS